MPLTEALLCEVPVIAPRSTGMVEYLDDSIAELVPTSELPAEQAKSPFAGTFAKVYGFPGITYEEPDLAAARVAMRRTYEHHAAARAKARVGAQRILTRFSWENAVGEVSRACVAVRAHPG
jgi:glycosyltransferase involved in cell wall biosynthesis